MRFLVAAAAILLANLCGLAALQAEAQGLPKYLKSCKKDPSVKIHDYTYKVPSPDGPPGLVTVTHERYECKDPETRKIESVYLHGMTDSSGKVVVPVKYAQVLPFSTKGALVLGHGNERYPKTLNYRTYIAGKGEGKDRYTFDNALRLHPDGTCSEPDVSDGSLISVTGLDWHTDGSGRMDVTLFTADGKTRRLENMGGEGAGDAALRVGDVFLASWKDEGGAVRSGILDLDGRPIAPVLGKPAIWSTLVSPGPDGSIPHGCEEELSQDLFIEGPSLDLDPAKPFFGSLLIPVRRDGQPAVLPEGAIGMFPAFVRERNTARKDRKQNAVTWGVVFPATNGFQFTLHVGSPSEALIAAATAPRYSDIGRSIDHGGMVGAKSVADGLWRWFRADTDIPVGAPNADFQLSLNSAWETQNAEIERRDQLAAAERAKAEAERAEAYKRAKAAARAAGRICDYRVDSTSPRAEVVEYVTLCGPSNFPGLADLARANGMSDTELEALRVEAWQRQMAKAKMLAEAEEAARIQRMNNANKDPLAGYFPGQWETAIRLGGNAAVDAINQSTDNWLQERRDQYVADWQRSQRAY